MWILGNTAFQTWPTGGHHWILRRPCCHKADRTSDSLLGDFWGRFLSLSKPQMSWLWIKVKTALRSHGIIEKVKGIKKKIHGKHWLIDSFQHSNVIIWKVFKDIIDERAGHVLRVRNTMFSEGGGLWWSLLPL